MSKPATSPSDVVGTNNSNEVIDLTEENTNVIVLDDSEEEQRHCGSHAAATLDDDIIFDDSDDERRDPIAIADLSELELEPDSPMDDPEPGPEDAVLTEEAAERIDREFDGMRTELSAICEGRIHSWRSDAFDQPGSRLERSLYQNIG